MIAARSLRLPAILAALLLAGCSNGPEATVERFYRAVAAGNAEAAKAEMSVQLIGMLPPAKISAMLAEQSAKYQKCGGIKTVSVALNPATNDLERRGQVTVTFGGACSPNAEKIKLVKEAGRWKIGADK